MNILVVYLYGKENRGDYAITQGLMDCLSNVPNAKIVSMRAYLGLGLRSFCRLLLTVWNSDIVISNGGYLFYRFPSTTGVVRSVINTLFPFGLPLVLARCLRRPYGFCAQSFGPFTGLMRVIMKWLFNGARFIHARESVSLRHVLNLGVNPDKCQIFPDLSFFFNDRDEETARKVLRRYGLAPNKFLGVTVRRSTFAAGRFDDATYWRYLHEIAAIADLWIEHTSMPVAVFAQTINWLYDDENDMKCALQLKSLVRNKDKCIVIQEDLPAKVLKPLYGFCRVLLGSRLHSVIFAVMEGTPVIALDHQFFGPKTRGIMKDLGLSNHVFRIESLRSQKVFEAINRIQS